MWINRHEYENEKRTKGIFFQIRPSARYMWRDIEKLVKQNYPTQNIISIIHQKYKLDRFNK